MSQTRALIYKSVPDGLPVPGKDIAVEPVPFDFEAPPPPGGVVAKMRYSSFDPYLRGLMRPLNIPSYLPAWVPGQVFVSGGIAEVVKSDNPSFQVGDLLKGHLQHQEYFALPKEFLSDDSSLSNELPSPAPTITKLDNPLGIDPRDFIGALGMPGLTAYSSLFEIGKPKKGETIFISAASGAVGAIVGQLAKHEGLYVIGSVGSDDKLDYIIRELGFDAGFNYNKESAAFALYRLAPHGLDIYYENVGGETLEAAINAMKLHGRIVACGMISQYNLKPHEVYPIHNLMNMIGKRLTFRGFLVADPDFGPKWGAEHLKNLSAWIKDGSFKTLVSETPFEQGPEGFVGLLQGKNFGKAVVKY